MKKLFCLVLLTVAGCTYPTYTVRRPLPSDPPLTREEIERMSTAGVSDNVMFELLDKRGAVALTPDDLVALKSAGAPDAVVTKAIASERKTPEHIVVENYYYPYYGYPYYGASFSYGVGFGYGYGHCYYGGYPRGAAGIRVYR